MHQKTHHKNSRAVKYNVAIFTIFFLSLIIYALLIYRAE